MTTTTSDDKSYSCHTVIPLLKVLYICLSLPWSPRPVPGDVSDNGSVTSVQWGIHNTVANEPRNNTEQIHPQKENDNSDRIIDHVIRQRMWLKQPPADECLWRKTHQILSHSQSHSEKCQSTVCLTAALTTVIIQDAIWTSRMMEHRK